MATGRNQARRPVIELAPAAERGEHWWPVATAIIAVAGLHVAPPARYRVRPGWVVPAVTLALVAVLIAGDPGRIDRQKAWLRVATGIVIALRWPSSRAPRIVLFAPFRLGHGPRPSLGPFGPARRDMQVRKEQGRVLLAVQAAVTCSSARIRVPFHRVNQTTHRLHHPPWAGTAMEQFLAAVLARAACLVAGALIVRLSRAFLAMPGPARPSGPRGTRLAWRRAGMRRQCPGPAGRAGAGAYGDDG